MHEFGNEEIPKLLTDEKTFFLLENEAFVENLKEEIELCKEEQLTLRAELDSIRENTKNSTDLAQENFLRFQDENRVPECTEFVSNLEKRLLIVQSEKDSIFQLWQMALKAIDVLEEQINTQKVDNKAVQDYEDEIRDLKRKISEDAKDFESQQLRIRKQVKELSEENSKFRGKLDEAKRKVGESLEIVEAVSRERDIAVGEKHRVEVEFSDILDREKGKIKEIYEKNEKFLAGEIEKLKSELHQQLALREKSEEALEKSLKSVNILEENLRRCEESSKVKTETLEKQLTALQEQLSGFATEKIRWQRDDVERCRHLEDRLTRALDDKEKLCFELRALQMSLERESHKRDHEKETLEMRILELREELKRATTSLDRNSQKGEALARQISALENQVSKKHILPHTLKAKYEEKLTALTRHVEVHQQLNKGWKDEVKLLTAKFQKKSKEQGHKMKSLKNENSSLNKELLLCRQKIAQLAQSDQEWKDTT